MMDRQQAMTEAEGYIERMNLKALSEKDNDQLIRMRLSAPYHSTVNKDALAVCKALQEIAGNYKISIHTRIINTAVKVIGIKIDNMNFNCD